MPNNLFYQIQPILILSTDKPSTLPSSSIFDSIQGLYQSNGRTCSDRRCPRDKIKYNDNWIRLHHPTICNLNFIRLIYQKHHLWNRHQNMLWYHLSQLHWRKLSIQIKVQHQLKLRQDRWTPHHILPYLVTRNRPQNVRQLNQQRNDRSQQPSP